MKIQKLTFPINSHHSIEEQDIPKFLHALLKEVNKHTIELKTNRPITYNEDGDLLDTSIFKCDPDMLTRLMLEDLKRELTVRENMIKNSGFQTFLEFNEHLGWNAIGWRVLIIHDSQKAKLEKDLADIYELVKEKGRAMAIGIIGIN